MVGGMAHTETFDPKHYEPFVAGMDATRILSTFQSRPTALDGVHFLEGLEEILKKLPEKLTEMKHYGMHRHFTGAGSVLMFGGGAKRGYVHGKTADERPCKAIENPVSIGNIHQTMYRALGIGAETHYEVEGRPFYSTPDGKSAHVAELLAKG